MKRQNVEAFAVILVLAIATFAVFILVTYLPIRPEIMYLLDALWLLGCLCFLVLTSLRRH